MVQNQAAVEIRRSKAMITKQLKNSAGGKLVLNVPEVAELLGMGTTATWEAVWRGEIPHIKVGRRVLVPRRALEEMLEHYHRPGIGR
jgi:excisionase family DNA binding protein